MAEPTKLPWKAYMGSLSICSAETDAHVARLTTRLSRPSKRFGGRDRRQAEADARLIVTAVNHHKQLVDALRDTLGVLICAHTVFEDPDAKESAKRIHRNADALLAEIDKESL